MTAIDAALGVIEALAPGGATVPVRTPLQDDECAWFLRAIDAELVCFEQCPDDCFRFKKWGDRGPDHFTTPSGRPRHLFSKPGEDVAWLNREYIPHIGAYAYASLGAGYGALSSSFSLYRKFGRDVLVRKSGSGYETDAEFYGSDGRIVLQIEAKASEAQTTRLAAGVERHGSLLELPTSAAKEIEYVVDLEPARLWIVGPGSIDPPLHVFEVSPTGGLDVRFRRIDGLPKPPA